MPGGACPAPADCSGLPAVASTAIVLVLRFADSDPRRDLRRTTLSTTTRSTATLLPFGEPVRRRWASDEFELYLQDSWRVSDTLTLTAGLRYSLFSPPWEANGLQVAPSTSAWATWFDERVANMAGGIPSNASQLITFDMAGTAKTVPGSTSGTRTTSRRGCRRRGRPRRRLGGARRLLASSTTASASGIATTFDSGGSFGLSTDLDHAVRQVRRDRPPECASSTPATVPPTYPAAPPAGFPQTPPDRRRRDHLSIDSSLRTPYSHVFNFVVGARAREELRRSRPPMSAAAAAISWSAATSRCR